MDESLFSKHLSQIKKQKNNKEEIIFIIKENTGIELDDSMIVLKNKEVILNISSVIKQKLFQNNIKETLFKKGYLLKI